MGKRYPQAIIAALALLLVLASCGPKPSSDEETCQGDHCTEADINAPINPRMPSEPPPAEPGTNPPAYHLPPFDPAWELARESYDKMETYYETNYDSIRNPRFVTIIDFRQPSNKKRFYLFDLANGTVERHVTAHGKNSDPDNDGYATIFSNTINSLQSSLGFYLTLNTYNGSHGYSLKLRGLSESNSNAETRAIVMHPADYVSDSANHAGRSWGCPALDPKVSKKVIDSVRSGSLLLIDQ
jgi:hypothetical protein